jgi:hypothetical protein
MKSVYLLYITKLMFYNTDPMCQRYKTLFLSLTNGLNKLAFLIMSSFVSLIEDLGGTFR